MSNKKTLALDTEQYEKIINTLREGFEYKGIKIQPNNRIATALVLQANLGLRISDVLNLTLSSIVRDGDRYRLDIVEQKTGKARTFTVPDEIYSYIKIYALENNIKPTAKLFDITTRNVQQQLKLACDYLGYTGIGTHSFRKYFATEIYINNNYDIQLVNRLLQHASIATTQRYIGLQPQKVEEALKKHLKLI